MSDLLNEVNDDLRRQKLQDFWRDNGSWIIGGAVLAIIMTAGMTMWRGYQENVNERQTGALISVLGTGKTEDLEKYAVETGGDHGMIARFMAAGLAVQRGDAPAAAKAYTDISRMRGIDGTFRDLARLMAAGQQLQTEDPAVLHKTLKDLSGKKDAWRYSAMEMDALVYSREGKMKEAAEVLSKITAAADAPDDVRTRAMTLRELYLGAAASKNVSDAEASKAGG